MAAGPLRHRVHAQERVDATDEFGNPAPGGGAWTTRFTVAAGLVPKHGGEAVMAGRLQGVQTYIATLRHSPDTATITPGWRLVDARDGRMFNVRSLADPTGKRAWLELLVEEGVAS